MEAWWSDKWASITFITVAVVLGVARGVPVAALRATAMPLHPCVLPVPTPVDLSPPLTPTPPTRPCNQQMLSLVSCACLRSMSAWCCPQTAWCACWSHLLMSSTHGQCLHWVSRLTPSQDASTRCVYVCAGVFLI